MTRCLSILVVLLLAAPALGENLTIVVTTEGDDGKPVPVPGARVAAALPAGPVFAEALLAGSTHATDSKGRVTIPRPPGRILVMAGIPFRSIAFEEVPPDGGSATLFLGKEAVLTGVVLDPSGRPVPAAEVLVAPESPAATGRFLLPGALAFKAVTDGAGRFVVYRLSVDARYRIRAAAKGLAPTTLRDATVSRDPLKVSLAEGAAVRGLVISIPGGKPVAGAEIVVGEASTTSGEDGRFDLRGVPAGSHRLRVSAAGHTHVEEHELVLADGGAREGLVIRVLGLGRMTGRILTPKTEPAAGARVLLRYPADPELEGRLPADRIVSVGLTDADGRFDVSNLLPARGVDLIAFHPEFAPTVYYGFSIAPARTVRTIILLSEGGTVSGRVLTANGRDAIEGARVFVLPEGTDPAPWIGGEEPRAPTVRSTVTGEDGSWTLEHVPSGRKTVLVLSPGGSPTLLGGVELSNRSHRKNLNVFVGAGAAVSGTVRDGTGAAVTGASVRLLPPLGPPREVASDQAGYFHIEGIPPGPYRLEVQADGFARFEKPDVEAPALDIEVALTRGAGISGRVLLEDSSLPVAPAIVRALLRQPAAELAPDRPVYRQMGEVRAEPPDGKFLLPELPPGTYRIEAWTERGHFGHTDGLVLSGDASPGTVDVRVFGGWSITGRVLRRRDRMPVEGATVAIRGVTDNPGPHSARTDAAGRFSVDGVLPGFHTLLVVARDYAPALIPSVEVRYAESTHVPDVVLSEGSEVAGIVTGPEGTPRTGLRVRLSSGKLGGTREAGTDEQGRFRFLHVTPGSWLVEAEDVSAGAGARVQRLVKVVEGEDLFLKIGSGDGTALTGTIRSGTEPVPHALVTAMGVQGDLRLERSFVSTRADAYGNYLFPDLPPGDLLLTVEPPGSSASVRFAARIEAGPVVVKDLYLPISGIVGLVEDLDAGTPVAGARLVLTHEAGGAEGTFLASLTRVLGEIRSEEDGRFRVPALPAGEYRIEAFRPGYGKTVVKAIRVTPGGFTPVRVAMPQAGILSGQVVDSEGRPVSNARVVFRDPQGRIATPDPFVETDPQGRFRVDSLRTGTYSVEAKAPGLARAVVHAVSVFAGGSPEITLRLDREGRIEVIVYGPGVVPIEGARISVTDFWGRTIRFEAPRIGPLTPFSDPTLTDSAGRVRVPHLPAGIYSVRAWFPGHKGAPTRIRVLAGELAKGAVVLLPIEAR